jgi:solute carrier family 25 protein 44
MNILKASSGAKLHERARGLYRGIGVVLGLAIPARSIYISTLEISRDTMEESLTNITKKNFPHDMKLQETMSPMIASFSGGMAGGLAAMSSQMIIVPMDIVSQHQMVMSADKYYSHGKTSDISRHILNTEGWKGFYRGFGVSLFSSLPTGSIWWATYSGCQEWVKTSDYVQELNGMNNSSMMIGRFISQLFSGMSAALMAATITQPLDVIKTRMQVGNIQGLGSVTRELFATFGIRGFYRGLSPRIMSMGLWGTVLSGAYEFLRYVSHKDYDISPNTSTTSSGVLG